MKKYVFVQRSVCNMGGSQQYLYRKINFLREQGFEVKVVVGVAGEVIIEKLAEHQNLVDGINLSPCFFNRRDQKRMIDEAIKIIDPREGEEFFIESCTASTSLWCEMIAEKLHCRHVSFDFEEVFHNLTKTQLEFHNFKHLRREICGISPNALPLMFKGYKEIAPEEAYCYRAMCSDPVDEVTDSEKTNALIEKLKGYDLVIGTIGRAEKPFLVPTLKGILNYINARPELKFGVLFIGGSEQSKYEEEAAGVFEGVENADFYCTGRIFPIPRSLIRTCAAFVSSSGSASATAREGMPTVAVSPVTFKANGILNYTTRFSAVPETEVNLSIESQLAEIIENKYCETHETLGLYDGIPFEEEAKQQFTKQIEFVVNNDSPLEYYDVSLVKKEGKTAFVALAARILGRRLFLFTLKLLGKSNITLIKG